MAKATIVCGPPGSGKTTLVDNKRCWGDILIDWDRLWVAISGQGIHDKPYGLWPIVNETRIGLIESVVRHGLPNKVWVIGGMPTRNERAGLKNKLGADAIILETAPQECLRRIQASGVRERDLKVWEPLIVKWWEQYQRIDGEVVIKS